MNFSILVPVYNTPIALLKRSVFCLMNQTYKNYKVYFAIMDKKDNDNEEQYEFLYKLWKDNPSIVKLYRFKGLENVSQIRNKLFNLAQEEYVIWCDSDDRLSSRTVEVLTDLLEKEDYDVVSYSYQIQSEKDLKDGDERRFSIREGLFTDYTYKGLKSIPRMLWTKCMKVSYIKQNLITFDNSMGIYEDTYYTLRVLFTKPKMYCCNRELYTYIKRQSSVSTETINDNTARYKEVIKKVSEYAKEWKFTKKELDNL